MESDSFGDRMKLLEQAEAGRQLIPLLPIMIRLDGKGFHNWTKGLNRPYDIGLSTLMKETTRFLVEETNAKIGYTQSDEISLILYSDTYDSQPFFNGKIQKLNSVICSMTTAFFNHNVQKYVPAKIGKLAIFDCRIWNVPTQTEAVNTILWREQDASKNSISMAARHYFSHKQLQNKTGSEMQEMLFTEKNVNWNDYPAFFKRGTFIQRKKKMVKFSAEEINNLPEKHQARTNPDLVIERTVVEEIDMPKFSTVKNRNEVVFDGQDPVV